MQKIKIRNILTLKLSWQTLLLESSKGPTKQVNKRKPIFKIKAVSLLMRKPKDTSKFGTCTFVLLLKATSLHNGNSLD